jgi:hypothetical protein
LMKQVGPPGRCIRCSEKLQVRRFGATREPLIKRNDQDVSVGGRRWQIEHLRPLAAGEPQDVFVQLRRLSWGGGAAASKPDDLPRPCHSA